jgi:hypothetical protein
MKAKELPILSVVLYILAVVAAAGAVVAVYDAYLTITAALAQGMPFAEEWPAIFSHIIRQGIVYFVYPLLLLAAGRILQHAATAAHGAGSAGREEAYIYRGEPAEQVSITDIITQNNVAEDDNEDE